jgi:hypothetical protein
MTIVQGEIVSSIWDRNQREIFSQTIVEGNYHFTAIKVEASTPRND